MGSLLLGPSGVWHREPLPSRQDQRALPGHRHAAIGSVRLQAAILSPVGTRDAVGLWAPRLYAAVRELGKTLSGTRTCQG